VPSLVVGATELISGARSDRLSRRGVELRLISGG